MEQATSHAADQTADDCLKVVDEQPRFSLARNLGLCAALWCAASAAAATAIPQVHPVVRPITGQPWSDMDYGPFLTASIAVPGAATNIAYKGIAIRLGDPSAGHEEHSVLFDTDLLRYAAGWMGGHVALKGVVFDGEHWAFPQVDGQVVFHNPPQPGWAQQGRFTDPRREPYGPLPASWGRWQGLYLHGQRVVLSYRVGGAHVLESPSLLRPKGLTVFSRLLQRGPSEHTDLIQVASEPSATFQFLQPGQPTTSSPPASARGGVMVAGSTSQAMSKLVLGIGARGLPPDASWVITPQGDVQLRLPPSDGELRVEVLLWRGASDQVTVLQALADQPLEAWDLRALTQGGPARWPAKLTTVGRLARNDGAYVIDTLTAPEDNPWRSWLRFSGIDFLDQGRRAAVSTWNGDVWMVDGVAGSLSNLVWQRIATGLFQPLGLKVVDETIYVLGRDQITRLHDLNGDGEADFYENFNNDTLVSEHFHEFATDLKTDDAGNFYFVKCARHALPAAHSHHGTLVRVAPDGSRSEILARGFRAVNGLGVGPRGEITCVDNQGHWMPANRINWIQRGGFYGNLWAWQESPPRQDFDPPLCWVHNFVDRSGGTHLWTPSNGWGVLRDALITLSYGMGHLLVVLPETSEGIRQGGVTRLPLEFDTGVMRGVFHPQNHQLYACGLYGWAGNKTRPGGVYRIRSTGQPAHLVDRLNVARDGIVLHFTDPLDPVTAIDAGNYDIQAWNYRWTEQYGSPELRADGKEGRDRWSVSQIRLSKDGCTVFLAIPDLRPVMQAHIQFKLRSSGGAAVENFVHHTIHRLGTRSGAEWIGDAFEPSAPSATAAAEELLPGLIQHLTAGENPESADVRRVRLPALYVAPQTPATPWLPAKPFRSVWEGQLHVDLNQGAVFRGEGSGSFELQIHGNPVLAVAPGQSMRDATSGRVALRRGPNRFRLDYRAPQTGSAQFRLLWSLDQRPWEPIPATALTHARSDESEALRGGDLLRQGRELFATRRCSRCHQPETPWTEADMPELLADAPDLSEAGRDFHEEWLAQHLLDPQSSQPQAVMPSVLPIAPEDRDRDARDIAIFLASLRGETPAESPVAQPVSPVDQRAGAMLYEELGCAACHRLPDETALPQESRLTLDHVPSKWKRGNLASYLMTPAKRYTWNPMPHFSLTTAEALQLEAFLLSSPVEARRLDQPLERGDAARGRQRVDALGCLACHTIRGFPSSFEAPALTAILKHDALRRGCLATTDADRRQAPQYNWKEPELEAIRAFLGGPAALESLRRESPAEFAERQYAALRCSGCHARDTETDLWSLRSSLRPQTPRPTSGAEGDEDIASSAGSVHLGRPSLTFAGEKLHATWMQQLLSGTLPYKPRPANQGRMPAFRGGSAAMASGLAHQHGMDDRAMDRQAADPALARVGQSLSLIGDGFGCVACHPVGDQPAAAGADTATINFAFIADRLRPEYYWRYIQDPQRFRPGTMMPNFIAEDGSTPITSVLDGNAPRQFEALWQYLLTLQPPRPRVDR